MLQSFYNGLGAMNSYSQGLDTISDNVANMNTVGFRAKDSRFSNMLDSQSGRGLGAQVADPSLRDTKGEIRGTGVATNLAITGGQLFYLRSGDEMILTRSGQFELNENDTLVHTDSGYIVQAVNESGVAFDINIEERRELPFEPTTEVTLVGELGSEDELHTVSNIVVFDGEGRRHSLVLEFTRADDGWSVDIKKNEEILDSMKLVFADDGTLTDGTSDYNRLINLGGVDNSISFNFGEIGTLDGVVLFNGSQSSVAANDIDGRAVVNLTGLAFDDFGQMIFSYANGEEVKADYVALADTRLNNLNELSGSYFTVKDRAAVVISRAGQDGFGAIIPESLELSNVDLTDEFANILIMQRGYQAGSRIMTVANEMIEQLYGGGSRG